MSKYTEKERRFMQSMHDRSVELYEHIRDLALRAARDEETEQGDAATQRSVDGSERQDLRRTVEVRSADGDGSNPSRISETNQPAASPTSDSPLSAGWPTRGAVADAIYETWVGTVGFQQTAMADAALALFEPVRAEMENLRESVARYDVTAEAAQELGELWGGMMAGRTHAHGIRAAITRIKETEAALTAAREENDELRSKAQNDGWHRAFLAVRNQAQRLEAERDAARAALAGRGET